MNNNVEITLLRNSEWRTVLGQACRVLEFTPLSAVRNGKVYALDKSTPYASVLIECIKLPDRATGFITHKTDFLHLWAAFKERSVANNEEVIIYWTDKNYKYKWLNIISSSLPKLWVTVCPKGAYELISYPDFQPELGGQDRFLALRPITDWKPEIMA